MIGAKHTLSDGRALGYAAYGDLNGQPIVCFINNNSRRFYPFDDSIARSLHACLILVERPGVGLSDPKPGRMLLDWPEDVMQLMDALGVGRASVLGVGGGGPHAAACALKLGGRIHTLMLVSSFAPIEHRIQTPGTLDKLKAFITRTRPVPPPMTHDAIRQDSVRAWRNFHERLPEGDKEIIQTFGPRYLKPAFMRDVYDELYKNGVDPMAQDEALMLPPWGFDLTSITTPTQLWHGEADTITPIAMGRMLAAQIPNVQSHFLPNEGHLLYLKHWKEILANAVANL
jgi:pimeloyl-ACP methyl ester carboxylesterase